MVALAPVSQAQVPLHWGFLARSPYGNVQKVDGSKFSCILFMQEWCSVVLFYLCSNWKVKKEGQCFCRLNETMKAHYKAHSQHLLPPPNRSPCSMLFNHLAFYRGWLRIRGHLEHQSDFNSRLVIPGTIWTKQQKRLRCLQITWLLCFAHRMGHFEVSAPAQFWPVLITRADPQSPAPPPHTHHFNFKKWYEKEYLHSNFEVHILVCCISTSW